MKRMEDNQPGKEETERNYISNYQSHSVEKNFYSSKNSLSSNENDTIVETQTKNVKLVENSSSSSSKNEKNTDVADEYIDSSKYPSSPDKKHEPLVFDKFVEKDKSNLDAIGAIKDDLEPDNENQYSDRIDTKQENNENKQSDTVVLNKVSPLPICNPNNYLGKKNIESKNTTYSTSAEVDYISETYRNIVKQINDVSEGFKKGKKWKCNNPSHCHHHHNHRHYHQPHCRQYITHSSNYKSKDVILEHSKEILLLRNQKIREMEDSIVASPLSDSVFEHDSHEGSQRVLVRQMATEHSQDYDPEDIAYYDVDEDVAIVIESETPHKSHRCGNQRLKLLVICFLLKSYLYFNI